MELNSINTARHTIDATDADFPVIYRISYVFIIIAGIALINGVFECIHLYFIQIVRFHKTRYYQRCYYMQIFITCYICHDIVISIIPFVFGSDES